MEDNIDHSETQATPGAKQGLTSKTLEPNIMSFAMVTLLALLFSLGSLNTISARQAALADAEADVRVLQERITASIFLSLDADINAPASLLENPRGSVGGKEVIDPKEIAPLFNNMTQVIAEIRSRISGGKSSRNIDPFDYLSLKIFSSDTLLGILLISCGILGSIMSTMRGGHGQTSKAIVLGASVGFIALLGVKGGSTVFLMTSLGVDVAFNPYSTAFVGVVAGMFSEKLYIALSKLTDRALGESDNANK